MADRRCIVDKQGTASMLIVDRNIVMIGRKWRSKWWKVSCTCGKAKRRKDGSCRHERMVFDGLAPEIKCRASLASAANAQS